MSVGCFPKKAYHIERVFAIIFIDLSSFAVGMSD